MSAGPNTKKLEINSTISTNAAYDLKLKWTLNHIMSFLCCSSPGAYEEIALETRDGAYNFLLRLYPRGTNQLTNDYLSISLHCTKSPTTMTRLRAEFGLVGKDMSIKHSPADCNFHYLRTGYAIFHPKFWRRINLMRHVDQLMNNDTVTVDIDITLYGPYAHKSSKCAQELLPNESMVEALHFLYTTKIGCDFAVVCAGTQFQCHKSILCARLEHLRPLLQMNDTTNQLVLEDSCTVEATSALLTYVYTDNFEFTSESVMQAIDIAKLADKHNCTKLVRLSELYLMESLSVEAVIVLIGISETLLMNNLFHACVAWIHANREDFFKSKTWTDYEATNDPTRLYRIIMGLERTSTS